MTKIGNVSVSLCDHLNPGFGYQIRVTDINGKDLAFTSRCPVTGADLLDITLALKVAAYYVRVGG